ncbi:Hypoticical protein [Pectobacterium parmentieri]|uniref:Hypoticical protein n=1 Tax=Pectobacterium parmentieri TaxID=1905730 RepID=A0A0H3I5Q4_PECPM|nr:Hypoticical protein [Pectobacterium parmentieri]
MLLGYVGSEQKRQRRKSKRRSDKPWIIFLYNHKAAFLSGFIFT